MTLPKPPMTPEPKFDLWVDRGGQAPDRYPTGSGYRWQRDEGVLTVETGNGEFVVYAPGSWTRVRKVLVS